MNYCYNTYLSKTRRKIMIIVNIGLETLIYLQVQAHVQFKRDNEAPEFSHVTSEVIFTFNLKSILA